MVNIVRTLLPPSPLRSQVRSVWAHLKMANNLRPLLATIRRLFGLSAPALLSSVPRLFIVCLVVGAKLFAPTNVTQTTVSIRVRMTAPTAAPNHHTMEKKNYIDRLSQKVNVGVPLKSKKKINRILAQSLPSQWNIRGPGKSLFSNKL